MTLASSNGPVLILRTADAHLAGGHDAEAVQGVESSARAIASVFTTSGVSATLAAVDSLDGLLHAVRAARPALVFNLLESLGGRDALEAAGASVLELLDVAFTGSDALALALCQHKPLAKVALQGLGLPVPEGRRWTADARCSLDGLAFPLFVKPARTDASHGIDAGSITHDAASTLARAEALHARYGGDVLIETYVDGRELNVGVLIDARGEAQCLPPSEILFTGQGPPIVTYDCKWVEQSDDYRDARVSCPAELSPALRARLEDVARRAVLGLGLSGYARVDVRVGPNDDVRILEVNPNPDLAPDAGLANAARAQAWTYDELILTIARSALERRVHSASRGA